MAGLRRASSGHAYFLFKDEREDAVLDCVIYRSQAVRVRRYLIDGARLQVRGKATIWAPRGRLQMVVDEVRPSGQGALLEALERLKRKLYDEGLFATERKRPLPAEPRVVGVVTSGAGAAFHDIRTVAFRRGGARLVLSPAQVQGEGAPASIVRALDLLERHPHVDVIIVGRGGGSSDDLMAFNDERVVRRIAAVRVPVVSAVGHEIDVTLADLAADLRAATPSQAAELVVPDALVRRREVDRLLASLARSVRARLQEDRATVTALRQRCSDPRFVLVGWQQHVDDLMTRMERDLLRRIRRRREAIQGRVGRLMARHPRAVVANARSQLATERLRLRAAMRLGLARAHARVEQSTARLQLLSPLAVLARGYAIVQRPDGEVVRFASALRLGEPLRLRLARGEARVDVVEVDPDDRSEEVEG